MNRREFTRDLVIAASAMAAGSLLRADDEKRYGMPLGMQLYSVRHECEKDLPGTLAKLHSIGYREVEMYSFYGKSVQETKGLLSDAGLKCRSAHYQWPAIKAGFDKELEYAHELGLEYVVCAWIPEEFHRTTDDWLKISETLNKLGERCKAAGIQLTYHNHNYEFRQYGKETAFDLLMHHTDPKLMALELDCYWMVTAGHDPIAYLNSKGQRCRLLHIKDRKAGFESTTEMNQGKAPFAVLGQGSIDYHRILEAGKKVGVRMAYIDQDECDSDAMTCADQSWKAWQKV